VGLIQHNAIVAVANDEKELDDFRRWLESIDIESFPMLVGELNVDLGRMFKLGDPTWNGYCTVTMVADGSKEGWGASKEGDTLRDMFVEWLSSSDRYWSWVEVSFGEVGQGLVRGNCSDDEDEQGLQADRLRRHS